MLYYRYYLVIGLTGGSKKLRFTQIIQVHALNSSPLHVKQVQEAHLAMRWVRHVSGVLVAEVFEYTPGIQTASLSTYLKTNLFLFLFALGFYLLLRLLDIDLLWSVPIAKKWCVNPDWIHIDTTPFAGLVRNLGVLFGLGFAINSEMFLRSCRGENGYRLSFRLLCTLASLTTLQLYHFIKIPTDTEYLFYVLSFCKSASIPLTVVALIPYCIHMLMKPSAKKLN
ncbi:hypothetical protein R6Z07F_002888 [Ovis aries]